MLFEIRLKKIECSLLQGDYDLIDLHTSDWFAKEIVHSSFNRTILVDCFGVCRAAANERLGKPC